MDTAPNDTPPTLTPPLTTTPLTTPPLTTPPRAEARPVVTRHHGIERRDDYAWLRAENWQEVMRAPETLPKDIRAHLEAENTYTQAVMADTKALREMLFAEMKGRIKEDDSSVPTPDGPWAYYTSFVTGGEYPLVCRRPRGGDGAEQVLIDGNALGAELAYFSLGAFTHSPDHRRIAYAVDDKGSEYYTIRFYEPETGLKTDNNELADAIPDTNASMAWAADGETLFYTKLDENHRPYAVFRHRLGTPIDTDVLIYREDDPGFFVGVGTTQSRAYLIVSAHEHQTSEIRLIPTDRPDAEPILIAPREAGHEYDVEHVGDRLIIRTNEDGAEDFKLMQAPLAAPGRENWREIEPHRPGRLIIAMTVFSHHLVRLEREDGLPRIVIRRWADGAEHIVAFAEEAYSLGLSSGYEFDTTTLRFIYSSMTTPAEVHDYDMESHQRVLRKRQEVPSGHDPADYITRRLMAPAPDGDLVPVTLLYAKTTPLDGSAPLLLYGYGAYGIAIPAAFSTNRLSLVDRGFVYAIAHVRGGKEKGYRWYAQGRREKKIATFTDFIAVGEHLAREGFTSRGHLIAHGGSAGGMLMGAVANMAPDLFRAIIAEVPFVDVLATMLDASLPLTPPERPEWGNPIESEADYRIIKAYSPYDNVRRQAYPNILAMAGLTDPRVTYWEPAKWVAKLRACKTDDNLLLLKTNMAAGHAGASGRFSHLEEVAFAYAFALKVTGQSGGLPA